jgi:hypothetical protein
VIDDRTALAERDGPGGALFWTTAAVGVVIVAAAVVHLIDVTPRHALGNVGVFVLGAGVAHDAVWAPCLVLVGVATAVLPKWAKGPIRVGLVLTATAVLVTWPETRGYGAKARNPSVLPLDYTRNLVIVLVALWAGVLAVLVLRAVRARR